MTIFTITITTKSAKHQVQVKVMMEATLVVMNLNAVEIIRNDSNSIPVNTIVAMDLLKMSALAKMPNDVKILFIFL